MLTHWSYVFRAPIHRFVIISVYNTIRYKIWSRTIIITQLPCRLNDRLRNYMTHVYALYLIFNAIMTIVVREIRIWFWINVNKMFFMLSHLQKDMMCSIMNEYGDQSCLTGTLCIYNKNPFLPLVWREEKRTLVISFYTIIYMNQATKMQYTMKTSSNGNIFHVTGPFCGEFTGNQWIPLTKANDP